MVILRLYFLFAFIVSTPDLQSVRDLYQKAPSSEEQTLKLISLLNVSGINATLQGYKGASTMIMAKHVFNPYSKIQYFNNGKVILEKAIQSDKNNIELRYLRYTIQRNAPSILNYNSNIEEDKTFLKQNVTAVTDKYLKDMIESLLNDN